MNILSEIRALTVNDIQGAFLVGMNAGYVSKTRRSDIIPQIPHSKVATEVVGDFTVVDTWITTPLSDMSEGWTIVYYEGIPVWSMHYEGWYRKKAIPFLKLCLKQTYVVRLLFIGGRGPLHFSKRSLSYNNFPSGDFSRFYGHETIHDDKGLIGTHRYGGRLLTSNY